MPTIVHFEIPSDDIERSRKFYNELFGWNIEKWTGSMPATAEGMEYWLLSTVDDNRNKATTGGMMKRQSPQQQEIINYFDVKSVQEYSSKVEQLGGKVSLAFAWLNNGYYNLVDVRLFDTIEFSVCKDNSYCYPKN